MAARDTHGNDGRSCDPGKAGHKKVCEVEGGSLFSEYGFQDNGNLFVQKNGSTRSAFPRQVVVTYADDKEVIVTDNLEAALVPSAVRPAGRRFELGSTHMVRVQRRKEEDDYGL